MQSCDEFYLADACVGGHDVTGIRSQNHLWLAHHLPSWHRQWQFSCSIQQQRNLVFCYLNFILYSQFDCFLGACHDLIICGCTVLLKVSTCEEEMSFRSITLTKLALWLCYLFGCECSIYAFACISRAISIQCVWSDTILRLNWLCFGGYAYSQNSGNMFPSVWYVIVYRTENSFAQGLRRSFIPKSFNECRWKVLLHIKLLWRCRT